MALKPRPPFSHSHGREEVNEGREGTRERERMRKKERERKRESEGEEERERTTEREKEREEERGPPDRALEWGCMRLHGVHQGPGRSGR